MPFILFREPVAGLSHLVAALVAIAGSIYLWRRARGDRTRLISVMVFGVSMVLLYAASATYHLVDAPALLKPLRKIDHMAVFVLIAGTFTPIGVNLLGGLSRIATLVGIWLVGASGMALKFFFFEMPEEVSTGLYLAMGWLGILLYVRLSRRLSHRALSWIIAGGVLYSTGAVLDLFEWPILAPGVFESHELFHFFVMGGTTAHFAFVARHVIPHRAAEKGSLA